MFTVKFVPMTEFFFDSHQEHVFTTKKIPNGSHRSGVLRAPDFIIQIWMH